MYYFRQTHVTVGWACRSHFIASLFLWINLRRSDINDAIVNVWKEIVIGYFYSSFEYYLDKVSDQWAEDFVLNEDTKNKIEKISTSAKRLSFTASSAIRSTIAFHELDSTSVKHTQNVLLHNINKYLKFIEENQLNYINKDEIPQSLLKLTGSYGNFIEFKNSICLNYGNSRIIKKFYSKF